MEAKKRIFSLIFFNNQRIWYSSILFVVIIIGEQTENPAFVVCLWFVKKLGKNWILQIKQEQFEKDPISVWILLWREGNQEKFPSKPFVFSFFILELDTTKNHSRRMGASIPSEILIQPIRAGRKRKWTVFDQKRIQRAKWFQFHLRKWSRNNFSRLNGRTEAEQEKHQETRQIKWISQFFKQRFFWKFSIEKYWTEILKSFLVLFLSKFLSFFLCFLANKQNKIWTRKHYSKHFCPIHSSFGEREVKKNENFVNWNTEKSFDRSKQKAFSVHWRTMFDVSKLIWPLLLATHNREPLGSKLEECLLGIG